MTYEYLCTDCGHQWEADQSIKDAPLKDCPSCSKQTAKRQVSGGTGFVLKGGGWYADLYSSSKPGSSKPGSSNPGAKAADDSSSSGSSSSSESSSSTSDSSSKSETKSEPKSTKATAASSAAD